MSKILRSHFSEPNATTLFNKLGNAKQMPTDTAQEFNQNDALSIKGFVCVQWGLSVATVPAWYRTGVLHAILAGLSNGNIRHELWPLLKNTIVSDKDIYESLDFARADEVKHISKIKNKQINVYTTVASEDVSKPHRNRK